MADRYTVAFPELGIAYLAERAWKKFRPHRLHDHDEMQVLWMLDGTLGLEMAGRRLAVPAGGGYLIPAGRMHNVFQLAAQPAVVFLDLRLTAPSTMIPFLEPLAPRTFFRVNAARLTKHARRLRAALRLPDRRATALVQAILWELLSETGTALPEEGLGGEQQTDPRLDAADRYLQDHAGRPIGVDDIAAAVDLSRSQLTRLYRQHFKMGPAERLRSYRVQKASSLLRGTTLPVKVIARMCGFICPNHFCRVFLQVMKTQPTDYRLHQCARRKRYSATRG